MLLLRVWVGGDVWRQCVNTESSRSIFGWGPIQTAATHVTQRPTMYLQWIERACGASSRFLALFRAVVDCETCLKLFSVITTYKCRARVQQSEMIMTSMHADLRNKVNNQGGGGGGQGGAAKVADEDVTTNTTTDVAEDKVLRVTGSHPRTKAPPAGGAAAGATAGAGGAAGGGAEAESGGDGAGVGDGVGGNADTGSVGGDSGDGDAVGTSRRRCAVCCRTPDKSES